MTMSVKASTIHRGSFYFDILQMVRRKETVTRKELSQRCKEVYNPSVILLQERSTGGNVFESHLSWDLHALKDLGLIQLNKRGSYSITSKGASALDTWLSNDGALRRRNKDSINTTVAAWSACPAFSLN